jgi:hypothetical protein
MKAFLIRSLTACMGVISFVLMFLSAASALGDSPKVSFRKDTGRMDILMGDSSVATYVHEDPAIPRPYFCQLKTLNGVQITRLHPPDPVINKGNDDHEVLHPGIWLAFGDINGKDFWRNKARIRHAKFIEPFIEEAGSGRFTVVNSYETTDGQDTPLCEETCTYSIHAAPSGYFLIAESEFRSKKADLAFGDQEEMGFGIRLNTPLTVKFGSGKILNSEGGENEKGTWGKQASWCAATGTIDGTNVGVALMPAPYNFRSSWFHTRDYGLMVANPFGKKSMIGPKDPAVAPDSTIAKKGDAFTFGCGVYVFAGKDNNTPDFALAYDKYLRLLETK